MTRWWEYSAGRNAKYLFQMLDRDTPITVDTIRKRVQRMAEIAGFPPEHYGAHSHRIGCASALLAAGEDGELVRALGGWIMDGVMRLYVHSAAMVQRCYSAKLGL